ncbi:MAG: GTPase HflX [Treponema sp.]|jgi:GTP-binding protein HflX|nr:GTPase HflX [Treponema sp.]
MKELLETAEKPKRAFLAGIRDSNTTQEESGRLTGELLSLARTLGLEIAGQEIVRVRERRARYGLGSGKALELAAKAGELGADCMVFDMEISPSQQRNWEKLAGIPAVDRQELIIQIFLSRAKTREAELQAALAGLNYSLPRLSHKYIDLSRQRGGRYGTRGSGETRLETDRRYVVSRIRRLEQELEEVRRQRAVQRRKRKKAEIPVCALVGYTNAGKSSLLNALTGADAFVEDKLFATLDPTSRRLETKGGRPLILTDTVGFIRRLPHALVDAFRSTLEEASGADMLVHVLDISDQEADSYYSTTMAVLRELDAGRLPVIIALNKCDRLSPEELEAAAPRYPGSVAVSAKTGAGLDELRRRICGAFGARQGPGVCAEAEAR